jgi:hypothetical protein
MDIRLLTRLIAAMTLGGLALGAQPASVQVASCNGVHRSSLDLIVFQSTTDVTRGYLVVHVRGSGPLGRRIVPVRLERDLLRRLDVTPELPAMHPFKIASGHQKMSQFIEEGAEFGPEPLVCFTKPE